MKKLNFHRYLLFEVGCKVKIVSSLAEEQLFLTNDIRLKSISQQCWKVQRKKGKETKERKQTPVNGA